MSGPQASSGSSSKMTTPSLSKEDAELEKILAREATVFNREIEVERILKAFKFNPYEILGLNEDATPEEIKKKYKQLSLFIHPDKTPHPRAPEAFDFLKKAESELSDKAKREELDALISQARMQILKANDLPTTLTSSSTDPRLKDLKPPYKEQLLAKVKELLIDEEVRKRKAVKMNLANEGLEARRKDEEVAAKKRKAEDDKVWEDTREQRVGSWRNFASNKKKKTKAKSNILG